MINDQYNCHYEMCPVTVLRTAFTQLVTFLEAVVFLMFLAKVYVFHEKICLYGSYCLFVFS